MLVNMSRAVAEAVDDEDVVCFGGFTHLNPWAAGFEIIRQAPDGLTLASPLGGLVNGLMLAAGCANEVLTSGATPIMRDLMQRGDIEYEEYTHFSLAARLAAGANDQPFAPVRTLRGSDIPKHNDAVKEITDPYTGDDVVVVPPLQPDVAFVHVQRASSAGAAHVWGVTADLTDVAFAAETTVVSAEEIVDEDIIRSDPNRTVIPSTVVDYVVEEPYCAHPTGVQGYYSTDRALLKDWSESLTTDQDIDDFLDEWVYGVETRTEYLDKLGREKLETLRISSDYAAPINTGVGR